LEKKVGCEEEIVGRIRVKMDESDGCGVSWVMGNRRLPGRIYIEASSTEKIRAVCENITDVYLRRKWVPVPWNDRAKLRNYKEKKPTYEIGDWVRIRKGLYKGDIALVGSISHRRDDIKLGLLARINMDPKYKRKAGKSFSRPPRHIFNPKTFSDLFGEDSVTLQPGERIHTFRNMQFRDGLLLKWFSPLSFEKSKPSSDELAFFERCPGAKYWTIPLEAGERVRILTGEMAGQIGYIISVLGEQLEVVLETPPEGGPDIFCLTPEQSIRELRVGDDIIVQRGRDRGKTGVIILFEKKYEKEYIVFIDDSNKAEVSTS
jgi:transcription elongation factor SPT5